MDTVLLLSPNGSISYKVTNIEVQQATYHGEVRQNLPSLMHFESPPAIWDWDVNHANLGKFELPTPHTKQELSGQL